MVVLLTRCRVVVPSHAEVERQFRSHSPGVVPVKSPDDLPWIPRRDGSAGDATAANCPQQVTGDRTSTSQARYACCGAIKGIRTGLIRVIVNVALHRTPFPAKGESVVAKHFVYNIVNHPGGTRCDITVRGSRAVRHLIVVVTKCKAGKSIVPRSARNPWQLSYESEVHRAVSLITVQISNGDMICEGRGERVLPVKARNRRVLWPCGQFIGDRNWERCRRVVARKLPPPEEIEVVLIAIVVVDPEHINITVRDQSVRNWPGQSVIILGLTVRWLGQFSQVGRGDRADASSGYDISWKVLTGTKTGGQRIGARYGLRSGLLAGI